MSVKPGDGPPRGRALIRSGLVSCSSSYRRSVTVAASCASWVMNVPEASEQAMAAITTSSVGTQRLSIACIRTSECRPSVVFVSMASLCGATLYRRAVLYVGMGADDRKCTPGSGRVCLIWMAGAAGAG